MSQRDHPAQPHRPDTFRFFCPKCLKAFQVEAAHKDKLCLCPACGTVMRTPSETGRN